jgi:hypothetical protein
LPLRPVRGLRALPLKVEHGRNVSADGRTNSQSA